MNQANRSLSKQNALAVHELFIRQHWTLSVAESCTGGRVSAKLTALAGASQYFVGGVISYANIVKHKLLGVPQIVLQQKGAVSQEVVLSMVAGALESMSSEFSLAVSGVAGPAGGTPEKPVGTVWIAVGRRGYAPHARQLHLEGSREEIIESSAETVLAELLSYSQQWTS